MGIRLIGSLLFELFPSLKNCVTLAKKKQNNNLESNLYGYNSINSAKMIAKSFVFQSNINNKLKLKHIFSRKASLNLVVPTI